VYREDQVGLLCGAHLLNAICQGPKFSEEQLTAISRQLDEVERTITDGLGPGAPGPRGPPGGRGPGCRGGRGGAGGAVWQKRQKLG